MSLFQLRQTSALTRVAKTSFVLLILWVFSSLSACDDSTAPIKEREILVEVPGGDPSIFNGGSNQSREARILVAAGDLEKSLALNGEIELGVILFDGAGGPISGERVQFNLTNGDESGVALSASVTTTDANGYARISFYAGDRIRDYEVEVSHPQSLAPVIFSLNVLDLPSGGLNITFDYQGPVALDQIEVYVVEQASVCDNVYYLAPPGDVVVSQNGLTTLDRYQPGALPAGENFGIVVRARTLDGGTLAAGGCLGDIRIIEDEIRNARVTLLLLPLNPAGTYEVINHFNFTDAIPGQVGAVIDQLLRFFGDNNNEREIGGLIFDAIEQLAREVAGSIGGIVIELIANWVEDDLNRLINTYIDNDAPSWIRDFFTIGSDLISVVSNMEVISEMTFTKARSDGTYDGAQNWVGLAFYWRLGCEENGPADCGRYAFTMNQLAEGANGINLVFGQFDGRVHSYNQGLINSHNMDLQYGRLILFVLNYVILPRFADGATSLSEGLLNLANCPGFADRITGGNSHLRLGGLNIVSRDRVEGWCTSAMSLVGSAASIILEGLEVDTRMDIQGELTFVEETDDLSVDRIIEGVWRGSIRTAMEAAPPFEGDFEGERLLDEIDGELMGENP